MKITLNLFVVIGLMFLIFSCSKDNEKFLYDIDKEVNSRSSMVATSPLQCKDEVTQIRQQFARACYLAMKNDPQFREFIYTEVGNLEETVEQFLYIRERNRIVYDGLTVEKIISQYLNDWTNGEGQSGQNLGNSTDTTATHNFSLLLTEENIYETILIKTPLLVISIPDTETCNYNLWNGELLGVAVRQNCTDEVYWLVDEDNEDGTYENDDPVKPVLAILDSEVHYLVNSVGDTHCGPNIIHYMPTFPYSISNCEGFIEAILNGTSFSRNGTDWTLIHHDEMLEIVLNCLEIVDIPGGGAGGGNPTEGCQEPCERDCETQNETLVDFKINGWGVYQNIHNQFMEKFFVFHGDWIAAAHYSNGNAIAQNKKVVTGVFRKRHLLNCGNRPCQGRWKTLNFRLWEDWDLSNLASPYRIVWAEVDPGSTTVGIKIPLSAKFKVDIPGIGETEVSVGVEPSISYTGEKIVDLGGQDVFYCDPIMKENNSGSITFRCN